jgi:hypothetical protein
MRCEDGYESLMGTELEVAFFPYLMSKSPNMQKSTKIPYPVTRNRLEPSTNVTRPKR